MALAVGHRTAHASWLMKALVWVVLASSIITVVDTFNIPDLGIVKEREDGRVMGFFGGPNESATVLAFYLPVALALYWNGKGLTRLLSALGLFAALLALMLFASRGAFAGILLNLDRSGGVLEQHLRRGSFLRNASSRRLFG